MKNGEEKKQNSGAASPGWVLDDSDVDTWPSAGPPAGPGNVDVCADDIGRTDQSPMETGRRPGGDPAGSWHDAGLRLIEISNPLAIPERFELPTLGLGNR